MGVHGLWKLIEASGKPVPLETLENKVLAVDVSIWLHQAIKGFQDSKGAPLPNAHLLGIYHRVCKLLYFKIKPVFVFDGGVPALKRETIAKRNQSRIKNINEANKIQKQLLNTLLKHTAVNKVLSEQVKSSIPVKPKKAKDDPGDDLFKLPPSLAPVSSSSEEEEEYSTDSSPTKHWDLHTIDEKSKDFLSLPADVRHEILTDLKETRKQNSWGRLHELPTQSDDFAVYQMKRLLKRYSVQTSLEDAEKEMGGHTLSLGELEALLNDHGVVTEDTVGKRIASDENVRYLYVKDVKKAMEKARVDNLKSIEETDEMVENGEIISFNVGNEDQSTNKNNEEINVDSNENKTTTNNYEEINAGNGDQLVKKQNDSAEETEMKRKTDSVKNVASSVEILKNVYTIDEDVENDLEYQKNLNLAIQLSLHDTPSTSSQKSFDDSKFSTTFNKKQITKVDSNTLKDSKLGNEQVMKDMKIFSAAKGYMMEYSGLTLSGIEEIMIGSTVKKGGNENLLKTTLTKNNDLASMSNAGNDISIQTKNIPDPELISDSEASDDFVDISESIELITSDNQQRDAENLGTKNVPNELMSDSDTSDDFLDVSETNEQIPKKSLEIVIDINNENMEDDIFGDIFSKPNQDSHKQLSPVFNNEDGSKQVMINQKINFSKLTNEKNEITPEMNTDSTKTKENDDVIIIDSVKNVGNVIIDSDKNVGNTDSASVIEPIDNNLVELLGDSKSKEHVLTNEDLKTIGSNLEKDAVNLSSERFTKERMAANITDQMYQEAQELLQLFGVPYIVAPMEAEAQCAFLNELDLTEGTITDDSDIWLFGGKTVYKNFFNQNKTVMEYRLDNIEHHFNLSRHNLIQLSLLVGSDYTVGLQGVGPVTALEILAAFPSKFDKLSLSHHQLISGLIDFRSWFVNGRIVGPGRATLRNKLKNLTVTENFPNVNVVRAYLEPEVETSREKFSWGKPDIVTLTDYGKVKFGWSQKKSEEILKPVIKRMGETKVQSTIRDYFKTKHKIDITDLSEKMSKRVKTALKRIGNEHDEPEVEKPKTRQKPKKTSETKGGSKRKPRTKKSNGSEKVEDEDEDIKHLKAIEASSRNRAQEIEDEVKRKLDKQRFRPNLHKKEVIPQREKRQEELMQNKLKAIEIFRKSKQGPGFVKKRAKLSRKPKDDAELSESSSD